MRAAIWYNNEDIRIVDIPVRKPGRGEMLAKVVACGICGSDVVEWYRLPRAPLIQGHEVGAEVVEVGEAVTSFKPGDRVFLAPKVSCGRCFYCRHGHQPQCSEIKERLPGGLAEYITAPEVIVERGTYLLPETISFEESTFIEPLACVVRAQKIAGIKKGQNVLVLGSGVSGLLHVQLAKKRQCRVVATDINLRRLAYARELGADLVLKAEENVPAQSQKFFSRLANVVLICTSSLPAVEQAWASVDKGGTVVFFAVPGPEKIVRFPANFFWQREVRVLTSYYCGPEDIQKAIYLLASRQVEVKNLITHRLPLEETQRGFRLVVEAEEALKVIIKPHWKQNKLEKNNHQIAAGDGGKTCE